MSSKSNFIDYQSAKYLISAKKIGQLPPDQGGEVAFIGRSNAGKSSALNVITGVKGLARTSKTPGRTQMMNFFSLGVDYRLVDLPGYGYAKVPRSVQAEWGKNIEDYLRNRSSLKGLIIVMDIRHPLQERDDILLRLANECCIPVHVLLTKADKLSRQAAKKILIEVQKKLQAFEQRGLEISVQLFSSHSRTGLEEAQSTLDHWYYSPAL